MLLGYNTNGMAHHELLQALRLLAELGYQSVAITIDHGALDPFDPNCDEQLTQVRCALERHGLRSVIETGARFLLDPRVKHEPTLVTADPVQRQRRVRFLQHAVDMAAQLGSDCVSLWSGILRDGASEEVAMQRLVDGLGELLDYAHERDVTIGMEPEPGMLIDTMDRYQALLERIDAPHFKLTLDVGHLHCQGELPIPEQIRKWGPQIVNVHLEDMRQGVHEHLLFGEGEMDFPPILAALSETGYRGGLHVELSRHSHMAPEAARRAMEFLRPIRDAIA